MELHIGKATQLKTIEEAMAYIAENAANIKENVEVIFDDSLYIMEETFKITTCYPFKITFKGKEKTVISGGKKVEGWKKVSGEDYYVADVKLGAFRQLYVNGERAQRARSKKEFSGRFYKKGDYSDRDGLILDGNALKFPEKATELEIVWEKKQWRHFRHRVEKVYRDEEKGKMIFMMRQPYYAYGFFVEPDDMPHFVPAVHQPMYLENALELLTAPGEWYYDRGEEKLYYMPREGEDINSAEIIAPQLEYAVIAEGTKGAEVGNINFENIAFMYYTWNYPTEFCFAPLQAAWLNNWAGFLNASKVNYVPGTFQLAFAKDIGIKNCEFAHLGSEAVRAVRAVDGLDIIGNEFYDISEGAIQLGMECDRVLEEDEMYKVVRNVKIHDNVIKNIGCEYKSAAALLGYYPNSVSICGNEISDVPYSAISMGWGWGAPTNAYGNVEIKRNKIYDFMKVLRDGGAIYLLGPQHGTVISENFIFDQVNEFAALYTDNGTKDVTAENNVFLNVDITAFPYESTIERVKFARNWLDNCTMVNFGTDCIVDDNYYFDKDNIPQEVIDIMNAAGRGASYTTKGGKYHQLKTYFNIEKFHQIDIDTEGKEVDCNAFVLDMGEIKEIKAVMLSLHRHGRGQIYDLYLSEDGKKFTKLDRQFTSIEAVALYNHDKVKGRYLAVMVESVGQIHHGCVPFKDIKYV